MQNIKKYITAYVRDSWPLPYLQGRTVPEDGPTKETRSRPKATMGNKSLCEITIKKPNIEYNIIKNKIFTFTQPKHTV